MRVQVALSILIMHFVGLRPGEFVESSAHRGSNEGLHWGDVNIMMIPNREGAPLFVAQLQIRNRKGRRDREDKMFVSTKLCFHHLLTRHNSEIENIREDPENRALCPMTFLLALAVADEALEGINTVGDLTRIRFTPQRPAIRIPVREGKRKLPIIRGHTTRGKLSPIRILTASNLAKLLTELGWRAGYKDKLGTYALRRGHGNQLDRKRRARCGI